MSGAREITVRVPASSANLGPGFDALALALGLHLRCTLRPASQGLHIRSTGENSAEIPSDKSNLIWKTFSSLARASGANADPAAGYELEIENQIPLGRGLGSSAAAILAGLALANEWKELGRSREDLVELATRIEGHPDNVAAAALGGLVVSCQGEGGKVHAVQCRFDPVSFEVVVIVPDFQLSTEKARSVLPPQYSRSDSVYNIQRAALLVAAMQAGRADVFREAMRDRLHQPYRAPLVPGFEAILKLADVPGLLGVALSGAGPSVVAFCEKGGREAGGAIADCFRRNGIASRNLPLPVDEQGIVVERRS